ncbi:MAG: SRPBCC family protein, partial [Methylobacteriaceae bacterium]|nr:SRPBCC family protein [Methylobacteriaceae bacterium]
MVGTLPTRQLSVTIDRAPGEVYDFACVPENFPKWAAGLGSSLARAGDGWIAQTALCFMGARSTEKNSF